MTPTPRSSCRRALPLVLPLVLVPVLLFFLRQSPHPDAPTHAAMSKHEQASHIKPRIVDTAPINAFNSWLDSDPRADWEERGLESARARRQAMKELIRIDPKAALENAVPYTVRRQLPARIVDLLEIPVSTTTDFEAEIACGLPGGRSFRQQWITLGGERIRAFTYGERAEVMTKQKISVHGIAIDDVMAMLDDPLREWSAEEVADNGHTGRIAQLGNRLLGIESDEALAAARQQLRAAEETLGPFALPAYRDLALGNIDGMSPIALSNGGGGSNDDDLPPIAFSPQTEGAKKILYIRARFANEPPGSEPISLAEAETNQTAAEAFWFENSYGKSTLTTTYTSVVTLPSNGSAYIGNFMLLLTHARQAALAANSVWDYEKFTYYTVITNDALPPSSFGYIGFAQLNNQGSHLLSRFTTIRTASHEYGHNLGLNHSEYWLTDSPSPIGRDAIPGGYVGDTADDERIEYGHKFAVMGSQNSSGDFENGRAHYTASDKNRLDWLAGGNIVSTTTSSTIRLYRHDVGSADIVSMTPGGARAIKIDLPASDPTGLANPYKYWLNYRMLPTDGIAGNWLPFGLQVDWRRDGTGFRSVMLDMTPYSRDSGPYGTTPGPYSDNDDKEDGVLLIGRTFSDTGADIHFTPVAKGGGSPNEWLDVVVNIGTQGTNTPPQIQNFTVSNATPGIGDLVNFSVTATDPNGDTLAYHWDMDDNLVQSGQLNKVTRAKIWNSTGFYVVRVEVSDMKGGKTTASAVIRVGNPTNAGMIHGRVTHAGRPVEGAYIRGGEVDTWTDSDGSYVLAGVPIGGVTVTAAKAGLSFSGQFVNPVQVTEFNAFGIDFSATEPWTGGDGKVAMVNPYQIELPLGFAAQFAAQAFDDSGNPVAFNPTWSVSGGGVIGSNGVFEAQSLGGPFVVTAQSGSVTATAEVTVVAAGNVGAANGTWINASGGSWTAAGNWAGSPQGVIAGGPGYAADFSTLNITADTTVSLDEARTIGNLIFGDTTTSSAAGWTLAAGTGGTLTLAGTTPTITVNPLGSGKFASISALLNGTNGFTKSGSGNLLLNNTGNSISGAVVLSGGNVQLNSASLSNATTVAINAGSLVVATSGVNAIGGTISFAGGTLQFNQNPGTDYSARFSTAPNQQYRISLTSGREATFSSNLASAGGTLTKLNAGTLILAAANSYSGGTNLSGGTLNIANAGAMGSGNVTFTGTSTLQAGASFALANDIIINSGVTGTVDTNGNNTTPGGILTGSGNLTKTGTGTLNITGGGSSSSLSGAINVNAGTLAIDNVNPSPGIQSLANMNGDITVASGATFNFSQSFTANNLDNNIILSGAGTGGLGALNLWRNATATGAITLAADATISHNFNTATISGSITGADRNLTLTTSGSTQPGLVISAPIQLGNGGITVASAGGINIVTLSGNNSYNGDTRVLTGTLKLTGSARINNTSSVRIDSGAVLDLDFAGTDTVGALYLGGDPNPKPAGTYGSLSSPATHKSADFAGNGILQIGTANNYESWAASQVPAVTGGPNGDDDNDGVKNLVEYALVDGGERGTLSGTTIIFTKRGAPYGGDLTCVIETSETLSGSWSPAVTHGPAELGSPISYDLAPVPGTPKKFARLKVVKTP